jgi:hypothetical protein
MKIIDGQEHIKLHREIQQTQKIQKSSTKSNQNIPRSNKNKRKV